MNNLFQVLVPVKGSCAERMIDPGSAIVSRVGSEREGRLMVHYESNRFGAVNMHRFVEKAFHAAGRAVERYPTAARAFLRADELVAVAVFDYDDRSITEITSPDALRAWAGEIGDMAV